MNVIFLDFDEVMNSIFYRKNERKAIMKAYKNETEGIYKMGDTTPNAIKFYIDKKTIDVDPQAIHLLDILVRDTESKVVISSTWRKIYPFSHDKEEVSIKRFKQLFAKLGYPNFPVIGVTEDLGWRGVEVARYLDKLSINHTIDNYLILDDGADFFTDNLKIMTEDEVTNYAFFHNMKDKPVFSKAEEFKKKSDFWSSQKLLRVHPIFGLTSQNILEATTHFKPDNPLQKAMNDYSRINHTYKLYNSN